MISTYRPTARPDEKMNTRLADNTGEKNKTYWT